MAAITGSPAPCCVAWWLPPQRAAGLLTEVLKCGRGAAHWRRGASSGAVSSRSRRIANRPSARSFRAMKIPHEDEREAQGRGNH